MINGQGPLQEVDLANTDNHVDEITVDDFFDVLISALDSDKDVFESNKQMTSDTWFGKQVCFNI